ncbi:MAG: geranylgeranyl reductase family protein, partial [Pseudomonadota bacterium]
MERFDIVILGAGPAGSAAAVTARARGLSVALIDKARFPRDKLCGGLVTGRCAKYLNTMFGLEITPELFDTRRNFEFHLGHQSLGTLEDVPPLHLTMRRDFDAVLLDTAVERGARAFTGCRVATLDLPRDRITLEDDTVIEYRCLIGADGVNSMVATVLFGRAFDPARVGFALEIEGPPQTPDETTPIRIDFAAARWGYGWSFPKRSSTTIGLGGLHGCNPDLKPRLMQYLGKLKTGQEAKIKGHFLPFGEAKPRPGRANVLLAGDAAGFVDPITGEGIGHAIHSGACAATAAARALREGQPFLASRYHRAATRPIRNAIAQARLLRPVIFAPRLQPFFSRTFRTSSRLKRDYMHLLSGDTEYPDILVRTVARLPAAALRHLRQATPEH